MMEYPDIVKLSTYAKREGIGYRAAWDRFHNGRIPGATFDPSGHIYVPEPESMLLPMAAVYARVSSHPQKDERDIHLSRLLLVRGPISRGVLLEAGRGSGDAPVFPAARVAPSSTWSWRRAAGSALGRGRQRARAVGRKVALGSSSVGD